MCGTWERQRGWRYKRFDAEPFCTVVGIGQGKSKNRRFLAAFFSIFLSPLKEIWPPEAYMQDAGAARNQRTRNGPSGTPAPAECMTGATAEQPRAVGDAGPYGGIDESAPVSGGAPMRAVGDAGPYGGIDESTPVLGGAPMRAVGDAGPYAVRHCRVGRGSGSGSCRRVPEPVIARHPRGAWERQRGEERRRFLMGLFASYHVRRKGIPKTMGLWRRFCILLPPRAKGCRAGARNIPARGMKGTSNGPSGTPAPTQ